MTGILQLLSRDTIVCDSCRRRFRPNLEDRPDGTGGLLRLFQCARCGHEHVVARISPRGVEIAEEIRRLTLLEQGGSTTRNAKALKILRGKMKREVTRPDGS